MFELQSCRITGREKRGDASNMFTTHIASYESTFVDLSITGIRKSEKRSKIYCL